VIAAKHADEVVTVFRRLYQARFPLQRMELVSEYGGDDEKSTAANNTSGFNCRTVAGTTRWSALLRCRLLTSWGTDAEAAPTPRGGRRSGESRTRSGSGLVA